MQFFTHADVLQEAADSRQEVQDCLNVSPERKDFKNVNARVLKTAKEAEKRRLKTHNELISEKYPSGHKREVTQTCCMLKDSGRFCYL